MRRSARKDICAKLEAAITALEAQATGLRQHLGEEIAKLEDQADAVAAAAASRAEATGELAKTVRTELEALGQIVTGYANAAKQDEQRLADLERTVTEQGSAVQAAGDRIAELENALTQQEKAVKAANDRVAELEQSETSLRPELDNLRAQVEEARSSERKAAADLGSAQADLEKAREELNSLRLSAERLAEAEKQLQAERRRAERLRERLDEETANGTKSVIAEQLAQALRDLEAAREETSALRAELDEARQQAVDSGAAAEVSAEGVGVAPKKAGHEDRARTPLMGEMLVDAGIISRVQLESALEDQRKYPQRALGAILVDNGYASEDVVAQAMACQRQVLFVHLGEETVDPAAARLISDRIARQHSCIPISVTDEALVLAMVDPLDLVAVEDVERASGRTVQPVVATASEISAAIGWCYKET